MPSRADEALDIAAGAVEDLRARCCEPDRSPRMADVADHLHEVRRRVASAQHDPAAARTVLQHLDRLEAVVTSLQVDCCAPNRLPLYRQVLEQVTAVRAEVTAARRG